MLITIDQYRGRHELYGRLFKCANQDCDFEDIGRDFKFCPECGTPLTFADDVDALIRRLDDYAMGLG